MALTISSYPNPFDPAAPFSDAYGWIAGIYIDLAANAGRVVVNVHPNESAWQAPPVGTISVALGELIAPGDPSADPPVGPVRFPRLDELMGSTDPVGNTGITFAQAYAVIGTALYGHLLAKVPQLAGSTVA